MTVSNNLVLGIVHQVTSLPSKFALIKIQFMEYALDSFVKVIADKQPEEQKQFLVMAIWQLSLENSIRTSIEEISRMIGTSMTKTFYIVKELEINGITGVSASMSISNQIHDEIITKLTILDLKRLIPNHHFTPLTDAADALLTSMAHDILKIKHRADFIICLSFFALFPNLSMEEIITIINPIQNNYSFSTSFKDQLLLSIREYLIEHTEMASWLYNTRARSMVELAA